MHFSNLFPSPLPCPFSSLPKLSFGFDVFSLLTTNRDLLTALPLPFAQSYYKGLRNKSFSDSPFLLPVLWRYDNHLTPSCSPFLQYKSYTIACSPYNKHLTVYSNLFSYCYPTHAEDTKIPFDISFLTVLSLPNIVHKHKPKFNFKEKHDYWYASLLPVTSY